MSQRRLDLPQPSASNFGQRMREAMQTYLGRQGNPLDRGITLRDLIDAGVVTVRPGHALSPGLETLPIRVPKYEPDVTPPPQPSGFAVSAAISHVFVEHDPATYSQGHGHLRTRVYGAIASDDLPEPVFADAVEIYQFTGTVGAIPSNPGTSWRLWIKWESADGVQSATPAGGTNGLEAITGEDVSSLVQAMTGPGNPFVILGEDTEVDGRIFPAGTYSAQAFIQDAQITRAKIEDLAVDDAKIADLAVSKLTAGSFAVGEYMQSTGYVASTSGWRINGNGGAEFSGVVVRGTVYASAGQIGGSTIGSTYIRSTTYALGESGWNFNSDGTGQIGGIAFLSNAMQSSNFAAGSTGWRLTAAGGFEANSGTFRGALGAATGTFSGSLSGATGTFAGALSAATGSFLGNVSAQSLSAQSMDVALRNVLQSGSVSLTVPTLYGSYVNNDPDIPTTIFFPAGTVFSVPINKIIATDVYDNYLLGSVRRQPFSCTVYQSGSSAYSGGNGVFNVAVNASVVLNRRYSPGGASTANDTRVYIFVESLVITSDTMFSWFAPSSTFNWILSRA